MTLDAGGILGAEWRSVARRHRIFSMRCGAVLVLSVLAWAIWPRPSASFSTADFPERGRWLFLALYYSTYTILLVCAPVLMGSAIAREKEHRTLELLLLTPLGSAQIVLGKFLSQFGALCLVPFAALPLVVACLFLGGVSVGDIAMGGLCLACLGLSVGAVAMLCSVFFSRTTVAVAVTYLSIFFYSTGVLWGGMFAGPASLVFVLLNPFFILLWYPMAVVTPGFAPWMIPAAIGSTAVLTVVCLLLSARHLRRKGLPDLPTWGALPAMPVSLRGPAPLPGSAPRGGYGAPVGGTVPAGPSGAPPTRQAPAEGPTPAAAVPFAILVETPAPARPPMAQLVETPVPPAAVRAGRGTTVPAQPSPPSPDIRTRPYRGPVWDDPVAWREIRIGPPSGMRVVQMVALIGVAILSGIGILFGALGMAGRPIVGEEVLAMAVGLLMGLQYPVFTACWLVLGLFAAQTVVGERRSGVLDTIQVTPITAWDYFRGKVAGCLHATRWLLLLWLILLWLMGGAGMRAIPHLAAWSGCAVAFLVTVLAFGLWASSRTDSPIAALTAVLAGVAVLEGLAPGVLWLVTDGSSAVMHEAGSLNIYVQAWRLLAAVVQSVDASGSGASSEPDLAGVVLFLGCHLVAAALFAWRAAANYRNESLEAGARRQAGRAAA